MNFQIFEQVSREKIVSKVSSFAYFKLPLFHARPVVSHALYDDRFATFFIFLYELINGDIIHMNSLNSVFVTRILDFQYIILSAPVTILGPFF